MNKKEEIFSSGPYSCVEEHFDALRKRGATVNSQVTAGTREPERMSGTKPRAGG
jgi:hypothetical protein